MDDAVRTSRRAAARAANSAEPDANPTWRVRLNAGPLRAALAAAKAAVGDAGHAPFKARVSKVAVPDYGRYVAPAREMWLDRVRGKLDRAEYDSRHALLSDVAAIAAAAAAYNGPSGGACRAPALVAHGAALVAALEAALADRAADLDAAEAAGARAAASGAATSDGSTGSGAWGDGGGHGGGAGGTAAHLLPPLPAGFEHDVRFTDAKPHGWAEYRIACPRHGEKRVDRLTKLATFFGSHAACRPEWGQYARRRGETDAAHLERLRPTFAFCKALPGAGPGAPAALPAAAGRGGGAVPPPPPPPIDDPPSPPLRRPSAALLGAAALAGTGACPPGLARSLGAACDGLLAAADELAALPSPAAGAAALPPPPAKRSPSPVAHAAPTTKRARSAAASGGGSPPPPPPAAPRALAAALADAGAACAAAGAAATALGGVQRLLDAAAERVLALDAALAAATAERDAARAGERAAAAHAAALEAALEAGGRAATRDAPTATVVSVAEAAPKEEGGGGWRAVPVAAVGGDA